MDEKSHWKPISFNENEGDFEGLAGFEELVSYDENSLFVNKSSSRSKSKKRKSKEQDHDSEKPLASAKKGKINYVLSPKVLKQKLKKTETKANTSISETNSCENEAKSKKKKTSKKRQRKEIGSLDPDSDAELSQEEMLGWGLVPLEKALLKGLAKLKFSKPTEIQEHSLPAAIIGKRDILGAAETGSGKTLAFGLPILHGILKKKAKEGEQNILYALVLTPTRELAIQVKNHLKAVAKYSGIQVAAVVGGISIEKQNRILSKKPEVVVATPGRLWELIQQGHPHLSSVENIKFLAIDETDRMVEKGHFEELYQLLERINEKEELRKQRQNFIFSATLTLVHEMPKHLSMLKKINPKKGRNILKMTPGQKLAKLTQLIGVTQPKIVDVSSETTVAHSLTESKLFCQETEKDYYLTYFLDTYPGRTLVFCNSIGCAKRLSNLLKYLDKNAYPLYGVMKQSQRLKHLEQFRDNPNGVLVATDVAARGLDIPGVDHVIHYQAPITAESYIHRSGRTARASKPGLALVLVDPDETVRYAKVTKTLGRTEEPPIFPIDDTVLKVIKVKVNLARQVDQLMLQMRKSSESEWLRKAAADMDILVDDDNLLRQDNAEKQSFLKKSLAIAKNQLKEALKKPILPIGFPARYPTIALHRLKDQDKNKSAVEAVKESTVTNGKSKKKQNRAGRNGRFKKKVKKEANK